MESNSDNIINEKGTKQNIVRDEEIVTYNPMWPLLSSIL